MPSDFENTSEPAKSAANDETELNRSTRRVDDASATRRFASASHSHISDDDSIGFFLPTDIPFERPGDVIGYYTLVRELGHGGFGTVWLAEQSTPIKRRVALKIIKLGMDTRQVVARFEQERQVLAMMDHPNIARVLDAGATSSGRPYFVMDLVQGEPMIAYCDRHRLTIAERLEIFEQVALAVQHAHGKGIIHRDLKPSNVLVGTVDGEPHATVIDFGIAKATSAKLIDRTLETAAEQVIGTMIYMSPEQAAGSLDIDTRTDVYALGVILYELLTGTTPIDRRSIGSLLFGDMTRVVREVDPPTPSSRIGNSRDTIAEIAENRGTEPKRLASLVRGELDWIVMKAVEKDRTRRYATASELAADLRRFIAGEPVAAAPPSAGYRIKKFIRRNRVAVAAVSATSVALIFGLVAFAWQADVAADERDRAVTAQRSEARQRKIAETALEEAEKQTRLAEERKLEAERQQKIAESIAKAEAAEKKRVVAINHFVTDALRASDPYQGGSQGILVTEAMQNAVRQLDRGTFRGDPDIEASLRSIIAEIFRRNGKVREAFPLAERALEIYDEVLGEDDAKVAAALNLAASLAQELGRFEKAEPLFVRTVAIQKRLHPDGHDDLAASLNNLALLHHSRGRPDAAEPLLDESLAMRRRLHPEDSAIVAMGLNNLAVIRDSLGKRKESQELYDQSLAMYRRLYDEHPELAMALLNTGQVRVDQSRLAEAEQLIRESVDMYRAIFRGDHPDTARAVSAMANVKVLRGDVKEAERLGKDALEMTRRLFPGDHHLTADRLTGLARIYRECGRPADAEPLFREALDMRKTLMKGDHPSVARTMDELAATLRELGRFTDAEALLANALAMVERLDPKPSDKRVTAMNRLADVKRRAGRAAEAEVVSRRALEMSRKLHEGRPDPAPAAALGTLARILKDLDRLDEAVKLLEEAVEILEAHYRGDHYDVAVAYGNLGLARQDGKNDDKAIEAFARSIAIHRRLTPEGCRELAQALADSAESRLELGDKKTAMAEFEEAIEIFGRLLPADHRDLVELKKRVEECR